MPHIVIEVSAPLLGEIDWPSELQALHLALAQRSWAELADLKSRVTPIAMELCGTDPQAQQLVATLTLTQPRPAHTSAAMAQLVFDHLRGAVGALPQTGAWVQCCVFLREQPKQHYFKQQWNATLSSGHSSAALQESAAPPTPTFPPASR